MNDKLTLFDIITRSLVIISVVCGLTYMISSIIDIKLGYLNVLLLVISMMMASVDTHTVTETSDVFMETLIVTIHILILVYNLADIILHTYYTQCGLPNMINLTIAISALVIYMYVFYIIYYTND